MRDAFVSRKALAEHAGVTTQRIIGWERHGAMPAHLHRYGSGAYYRLADVLLYALAEPIFNLIIRMPPARLPSLIITQAAVIVSTAKRLGLEVFAARAMHGVADHSRAAEARKRQHSLTILDALKACYPLPP